ncbi:MAG: hypothetical protein ABWW69_03965 [Pyrodictiaceae archaeon]
MLEELGFEYSSFSEMILTTDDLGDHIFFFPVGVVLSTPKLLLIRIFPGTSLYANIDRVIDVCLSQPRNPLPYVYAVLKKPSFMPELVEADSIHSRCVRDSTLRLEAIVVKRWMENNLVFMQLEIVNVSPAAPFTYKRYYGCIIEALIALTRIRYFTRMAFRDCSLFDNFLDRIAHSFDCVLHSTRDSLYHSIAYEILVEAYRYYSLAGCPIPHRHHNPSSS